MAYALLTTWISRFGVPSVIVSDRGAQFESELFDNLANLMGFQRKRTTSYNPACNGMVERWHRSLKASIMCVNNQKWTKTLPLVLLGLRTVFRDDFEASSAELVYGENLRLPGDMIQPTSFTTQNRVIDQMRNYFKAVQPSPPSRHSKETHVFVFKDLTSCSHVLIRTDHVRKPLQPPYEGPYRVVRRTEKYYTVIVKGVEPNVSINRLKPCFTENEEPNHLGNKDQVSNDTPNETSNTASQPTSVTKTPNSLTSGNDNNSGKKRVTFNLDDAPTRAATTSARSGRTIRRPSRFN